MPEQLFGLLFCVTGTPPWLLRPLKVSPMSELYSNYFWLPTFVIRQAPSFLIDSFPSVVSQATFGYLPFTVQHLCDLPHHWSPHASHPTLTQQSIGFS